MEFQLFEEAVTSGAAHKNTRLYALVDHAGASGLMRRLFDRPSTRWLSLFANTRDQAALDVAPLLFDIEKPYQRPWLQWFHDACRESTSLTLLHSSVELSKLAQSLRRRLEVMLPDDVPALFRYFDTRILESWLQVLEPEQRDSFLGIATCWQWLDRAGDLRQYDTVQLPADLWPAQFALSERQQNMMIDAAEADALVQQMEFHGMHLCRNQSRAALHALARDCITQAAQIGMDGMPTLTLFALMTLQLGPCFHQQPDWVNLLARVRHREITFEEAVKQKYR